MSKSNHARCQICGSHAHLQPASLIRPAIADLMAKAKTGWDPQGWICETDIQRFRSEYVRSLLVDEQGEVSALESEVLDSLRKHEILSRSPSETWGPRPTLGQRLADRIASFGGSWPFIGMFGVAMGAWILINSAAVLRQPFDPYPYILLNLMLSCLAALQAPVIMMSQNRQEQRDRAQADHDYQINLKAELERRSLEF
jgi:uncharacterized membrane protein